MSQDTQPTINHAEALEALDQAFQSSVDIRSSRNQKHNSALQFLEKSFFLINKTVQKTSNSEVQIFKLNGTKVNDSLNRDGAYHLTQAYVLALVDSHGLYKNATFVRHSSGFLNNTDWHKDKLPGTPYQSVSLHDLNDYDVNVPNFNKGNMISFLDRFEMGKSVNATPKYFSFSGDGEEVTKALHQMALSLVAYYGDVSSGHNNGFNKTFDELDETIRAVFSIHHGILACENPQFLSNIPFDMKRLRQNSPTNLVKGFLKKINLTS